MLEPLDEYRLGWLKPLTCDSCGKRICWISECDNQSCFYCDNCKEEAEAKKNMAVVEAIKYKQG